ncbi:MAG: hypothetical protein NVS9B12_09290 [Vulcanimicrobiaceae bacterium]
MDLTKSYPRSVRASFAGVAQLGRTTDKAHALLAGTLGEYHYFCSMVSAVLEFIGIDAVDYLQKVAVLKDDAKIEALARTEFTSKKTQSELDAWSEHWLATGPPAGSESEKYFLALRGQIAPSRTDVTSWPDLLDLDEKRDVPQKVGA